MYLWKIDKLVDEFSNENVTQYEQFKYMLVYSLLTVLALDTYLTSDTSYTTNDFIVTTCMFLITIWGVRLCYKANQQNDAKDFIARLICLGLPVIVRISVILLPAYVVVGIFLSIGLNYDVVGNETYQTTIMDVIFTIILGVSYYQYLSNKISLIEIVKNKTAQPVN
jgi:hypothetical protein